MTMHKAILEHFKKEPISFHVPGHHYQTIGNLKALDLKYDITEISGMDDYHHAESIIKESELLLNKIGYQSRFLVNGTTVGLLAVIMSFIKSTSMPSIAIMRNAHKSIYNGVSLGKGSAYILPSNLSQMTQEYSGVNLNDIDESLFPHINLAVLTYPNYYGETYDIKKVIDYFHNHNIPVLIDEAHGAHFDITDRFPVSTLKYGADFVVQSYHKTLPTFTMSSVIHMNNLIDEEILYRVNSYLSKLQSSSPSYMLMLGLEYANIFYQTYDDDFFFERRANLIEAFNQKFKVIEVADPLKIMLSHDCYKGSEIAELLESLGIYTELSNEKFVLCVLPLWHEGDRYLFDNLMERIKNIKLNYHPFISEANTDILYNQTDGIYISQETNHVIYLPLDESVGHINAEHIIPYPPGIPFILAGEEITVQHIAHIQKFIHTGGHVHGVEDLKIRVIG
ncbi:lysine decarboxylase [Macrococcus animalis]|uniref:Orn/Lys/Arg family decarboxylase n=1 Tax=Macrococcus animalis TaxID=3395467 RepID=UPI0039BEC2BD